MLQTAGRIGVHPDFERTGGVYFRPICHLVEEAIAHKASRLSLEPTGFRFKRHLGCQPKPMVNLVRGLTPAWQRALQVAQPAINASLAHLRDTAKLEEAY